MGDFPSGAGYEFRAQFIDLQRDTTLPGGTPDYQIMPVISFDSPVFNLTTNPDPQLNAALTRRRHIATDATVPVSLTGHHLRDAWSIFEQMLFGSVVLPQVVVTGTDIASTAASGGTATFTSVTASKFDTLKALVPCPAYIKRDGSSALATLFILTDVAADGLTLTVGDGTTGNEYGADPGVEAAGDTVTITVPRRFVPGVIEHFAQIEVADSKGDFESGDGMVLMTGAFSSSKGATAQWTWGLEGVGTRGPAGATFGSGTETAAPTGVPFTPAKATKLFFGVDGQMSDADQATPSHLLMVDQFDVNWERGQLPVPVQGFLAAYRHVLDMLTPTVTFTLTEHDDSDAIVVDFKACVRNSAIYSLIVTEDDATVNGMGVWLPLGLITEASGAGRAEAGLGTRTFGLGVETKTYTVTVAPTSRDRSIMLFHFDGITL